MSRIAFTLLSLSLIGCGDDKAADVDARPSDDAGLDASPAQFTTLATFDAMMGQLPEGVVAVGDVVYAGLAPRGEVVRIATPGMAQAFGNLPPPVSNTFTLGLAANAAGDIFVGVGASGANPSPVPGVYRIPAAGGTATVFAVSPMMNFPNSILVDGTRLYVTDSAAGRILEINQAGIVSVWLEDPMLAGDMNACGGNGAGFSIGANGIARDANNMYVAVTDHGRIVRIPIMGGGNAGTPAVHAESCMTLQGADGIALEASGTIVVVRNGTSNTMSRISADGQTVTPIHVGAPLDGPASVTITSGAAPQLVLTNSAFFSSQSNPAGARPSVLSLRL